MKRIRDPIIEVTGSLVPGMELLIIGCAGKSGTAEVTRAHESLLRDKLPDSIVDRALGFDPGCRSGEIIEILKNAGVSMYAQAGSAGICRGLWDVAEAGGVGLEVKLELIPIAQETVEICEVLDMDPYTLPSFGCFLAGCNEPEPVLTTLRDKGFECFTVGRATSGADRVLLTGSTRRYLSPR